MHDIRRKSSHRSHILSKCLIWQPAFFKYNRVSLSFHLFISATLRAHVVTSLTPQISRAPRQHYIHLAHLSNTRNLIVHVVIRLSTSLGIPVFWHMTLSRRVSCSRRFEATYCLHSEWYISVHLTVENDDYVPSQCPGLLIRRRIVISQKTGIRDHTSTKTSKRAFNTTLSHDINHADLSSLMTF
jgi:hypothetical protein